MTKRLKTNLLFLFIFICFYIMNVFLIIGMDSKNLNNLINIFDNNYGQISFTITTVISLIFIILYIFRFMIKKEKNEIRIENIFLIIILIIGSLYILIVPFDYIPDEKTHFYRSYDITEGNLITKIQTNGEGGGVIPKALRELSFRFKSPNKNIDNSKENYVGYINRVINKELDYNDTDIVLFNNTAIYPFVSYLPQALGIAIGRLFTRNIFTIMFLGRLFNLLTYSFLIYYSIKIIPIKKTVVLFLGLLPIALQEAGSYAVDGLIMALCIFYISYILNIVYNQKILSNNNILLLFILSIFVSLIKIVYLPMILLLLLIGKDNFKNLKDKKIIIFIILISILINISWILFTSRYNVELRKGVDTENQIIYILKNPIKYLYVVFRSTNSSLEAFEHNILGASLGLLNVSVGHIYRYLSFIIITLLFLCNNYNNKIINDKKIKILFSIVFLAIFGLINTIEYVKWTNVGSNIIEGIQGRYFLPILLLIPFILNNKFIMVNLENDNKENLIKVLGMFLLFLNIQSINCFLFSIMI